MKLTCSNRSPSRFNDQLKVTMRQKRTSKIDANYVDAAIGSSIKWSRSSVNRISERRSKISNDKSGMLLSQLSTQLR